MTNVYASDFKDHMKKYYIDKLKKDFGINFCPMYIQARKNTNNEYVKFFYKYSLQ